MWGYHGYYKEAMLLVALGVGYIVCYLANREEKVLRTAGYIIGGFIVILSSVLILIGLLTKVTFCDFPKKMSNRYYMPQRRMIAPGSSMMQNQGKTSPVEKPSAQTIIE